jgi:hypothetical protein
VSRTRSDRRIQTILAAFDRFVASPERDTENEGNGSLIDGFMASLTDCGFERFGGRADGRVWPVESVRAILLAFVLNCPAYELNEMAKAARKETKWLHDFERECAANRRGKTLGLFGMPVLELGGAA